jgi:hypothetical protein
LVPGVSYRHYEFKYWLFSFLISLPIYVLAYISIIIELKRNWQISSFIFYLVVAMLIFSVVWYVQNRFRTITIEPFYIIYSSPLIYSFIQRIPWVNKYFIIYLMVANKITKKYQVSSFTLIVSYDY